MGSKDKLSPGDRFPQLRLHVSGADELILPEAIDTPYAIVLFYRGHW